MKESTLNTLDKIWLDVESARYDVKLGHTQTADELLSEVMRQVERIKIQYFPEDALACFKAGKEHGQALQARNDDNERLHRTMEANSSPIGTYFESLREVYAPKEGSGPTHG